MASQPRRPTRGTGRPSSRDDHDQPFVPPAVIPLTRKRWENRKITSTGATETMVASARTGSVDRHRRGRCRVEQRHIREEFRKADLDRRLAAGHHDEREEVVVPVAHEAEESDERDHRGRQRHRHPREDPGARPLHRSGLRRGDPWRPPSRSRCRSGTRRTGRTRREDHRQRRPDQPERAELEEDRQHQGRVRDQHDDERHHEQQLAEAELGEGERVPGGNADDERDDQRHARVERGVAEPGPDDPVLELRSSSATVVRRASSNAAEGERDCRRAARRAVLVGASASQTAGPRRTGRRTRGRRHATTRTTQPSRAGAPPARRGTRSAFVSRPRLDDASVALKETSSEDEEGGEPERRPPAGAARSPPSR